MGAAYDWKASLGWVHPFRFLLMPLIKSAPVSPSRPLKVFNTLRSSVYLPLVASSLKDNGGHLHLVSAHASL